MHLQLNQLKQMSGDIKWNQTQLPLTAKKREKHKFCKINEIESLIVN